MPPPARKSKFIGEPIYKNPGPRLPMASVDLKRFEYSKVRPPPPLICNKENLPAFKTEKDLKESMNSLCIDVAIKWQCKFCLYWHGVSYPKEVTGTTGGKSFRKDRFKESKSYAEYCKKAGMKL